MARTKTILIGVTVEASLQYSLGIPIRLAGLGWDVHVVSGHGRLLDHMEHREGAKTHVIDMARNPSAFADLKALWAWLKLIARVRPEVVVLGTPKASLLGLTAAKVLGVPRRIYILHGLRLEGSKGRRRFLLSMVEKITGAMATNIVPVSQSLRDRSAGMRLFRPSKVEVLGPGSANGVEVERFREISKKRTTAETLRIGFVGRLAPDKGLTVLRDALKKLTQRGIQVDLVIAGAIEDHAQTRLIDELRVVTRRTEYRGFEEDVSEVYRLIDVLVLPSYREGFPTVVLEAAASGVPAVVSNATGCVDAVKDGITGLIFPVGDSESLAGALEILVESPDEVLRLGENALSWVHENYRHEKIQELYTAFYLKST